MAPIYWKTKIIAAKIETTEGTDAGPTGSDAILGMNVKLSPMQGQDVKRDLELAYFGDTGSVPLDLHAKLSFEVELAGSGTAGTAPAWAALLRACAIAQTVSAGTSVTYNPITTGQESVTLHFFVGATKFALVGARGTATIDMSSSAIPKIKFEFTGLYTTPAEGTRPTPIYTAWKRPEAVTTDNTPTVEIDGTALVMRSFSLDLGNMVEPRFLVGSKGVLITGKEEKVKCQVEAVPLTTFDPFTLAETQAELDVTIVHGTQAGNIVTFNAPKAQMQRPDDLATVQDITEWPLNLVPVPGSGADQWTLTLT